jgi:hypothetical protein
MNTVIIGISIYLIFVVIFGFLFFVSGCLSENTISPPRPLNWFDYLYFSLVTFSTIGYGEIIPAGATGKIIIMLESCIGLVYTPFFGGYLAYLFIQRPQDFFLTRNIYLRHNNNKIYLSGRVGNRGKPIVDCEATIAMFMIENNVKRTLFKHAFSRPLVEVSWYINLRLDEQEHPGALENFKTVLANPEKCLMRITFSGHDSGTGNLVHLYQYYTTGNLLRGGSFKDVYQWKGIERVIINWDNFDRTDDITSEQHHEIDKLLTE